MMREGLDRDEMERDLGSKSRHQRPSNDKKSGSATSYARVFVGDADRGGVMSGGVVAYVVIFVFTVVIFIFWC